jgi:Protein of unknown function (DUF3365)
MWFFNQTVEVGMARGCHGWHLGVILRRLREQRRVPGDGVKQVTKRQSHNFAARLGLAGFAGMAMVAVLVKSTAGQTQPPHAASIVLAQTKGAAVDINERAQKARELVQAFRDKFKVALHASLKADGVAGSVAPYQTFSAEIMTTLAEESQFEMGRTSTRLRNPDNAPDPWELAALEKFAADIKAGADSAKIEIFEITKTREGQNLFRYMTPIVMRDSCLGCHGTEVKADVKAEIAKLYSDDKALGYSLNEMRGAFTLVQQLD